MTHTLPDGAAPATVAMAAPARRGYAAYRDSGVPWLGDIPAHWEVKRLKYAAHPSQERLDGKPDDVPYLGLENIESGTGHLLLEAPIEQVESTVGVFRPGDVLFGKLRPYLAKVIHADFAGVCSTELLVLRPDTNVDGKFAAYMLLSQGFIDLINAQTYGTKMPRANAEQIGTVCVCLPSLDEQRAIAAYLDRETAHLDVLLAKKQRLIALLREKRAALISHAVTRGLEAGVPLKDSGVPWLGQIPAHWGVKRLAMAAEKITNGFVGPTRDIFVSEGVRYLQSLHIKNGEIRFDNRYFVTEEWSREHSKSILRCGDVLLVQTGSIGQCATVTSEFEGCNCHALIIIRLKKGLGSGSYLSALLRSDYGFNALLQAQTGALHPHLECGKVREIPIALPPPVEQEEIVAYVDYETSRIDALVGSIERQIEKLREYRAALIAAAVTGKIDVR